MLTAEQIVSEGIVYLSDKAKEKYGIDKLFPAQVGIDLHIVSCSKLNEQDYGIIYSDDQNKKTKLTWSYSSELRKDEDGKEYWNLPTGQYEIGFAEGCNFKARAVGKIVHRSSLRRCGGEINSPIWDPGFKTEEMGTFLSVHHPIRIYKGARVAQMIVFETKEDAELYGTVEGKSHYQGTGVLNGNN